MVSVGSGSVYELFLPDLFSIDHCFDGRSPAAHLALMGAFIVVELKPLIKILLQLVNGPVEVFAESDLIKLLQDRLVEALTDAICLRMPRLCSGVINIVDCEEQLVVVFVGPAAICRVENALPARRPGRSGCAAPAAHALP